jgi:hypothetical protein
LGGFRKGWNNLDDRINRVDAAKARYDDAIESALKVTRDPGNLRPMKPTAKLTPIQRAGSGQSKPALTPCAIRSSIRGSIETQIDRLYLDRLYLDRLYRRPSSARSRSDRPAPRPHRDTESCRLRLSAPVTRRARSSGARPGFIVSLDDWV